MPQLQFNFNGRTRALELKTNVTIGRTDLSDLIIEDPQLSRRHCRVEHTAEGWELSDVGSRTGTFVDGWRITHRLLEHGDEIRIGQTLVTFIDSPARTKSHGGSGLSEGELLELLGEMPSSGLAQAAQNLPAIPEVPDDEASKPLPQAIAPPHRALDARRTESSWSALVTEVEADIDTRTREKNGDRTWKKFEISQGMSYLVIGVATILMLGLAVWIEF